jgi:hypothetical protein
MEKIELSPPGVKGVWNAAAACSTPDSLRFVPVRCRKSGYLRRVVVLGTGKGQPQREDVVRIESRANVKKLPKTSDQQAGRDN